MRPLATSWALPVAAWLAGCTVHPAGEAEELQRAAAAGAAYAQPFADRQLPELTAEAPLTDWLLHAERANGALEAAFERWQAALAAVPQAGTQPSAPMLGVQHRLDGGSALDRTALQLMNDAMNNLLWPGKLQARAAAALAEARVAGAAFAAARLQLQAEVTAAFVALAMRDRELDLLQRLRSVQAMALPSVRARLHAGAAAQPALLAAEAALDRTDAELQQLQGSRPALLAALRAAVGAGPELVAARPQLPPLQPLRPSEQQVVDAALARGPALQLAAREAAAAQAQQQLAEWERVPGFALNAMLMGDGVWTLGGALTLPFARETAIAAEIAAAQARLRAAVAARRQVGNDVVAAATAERAALQAIEQQAAVLQQRLLPRLQQIAALQRQSWIAGRGEFAMVSDAETAAIEVERLLLRLAAEHAAGRARLAAVCGGLLDAPGGDGTP